MQPFMTFFYPPYIIIWQNNTYVVLTYICMHIILHITYYITYYKIRGYNCKSNKHLIFVMTKHSKWHFLKRKCGKKQCLCIWIYDKTKYVQYCFWADNMVFSRMAKCPWQLLFQIELKKVQCMSHIEVIPAAYSQITNLLVLCPEWYEFHINLYLDMLREIEDWVFDKKLHHENVKNLDENWLQLASYK